VQHALKFPVTFGTAINGAEAAMQTASLGAFVRLGLGIWAYRASMEKNKRLETAGPIASRGSLLRKGVSHIDPVAHPGFSGLYCVSYIVFTFNV
jgi:hypothetical protein